MVSITCISITILAYSIATARSGIFLPIYAIWIPLSIIFISIIMQIVTKIESLSKFYILILVQVFAVSFLIRLLFISPDNLLAGNDPYHELVVLETFYENNSGNGTFISYYPTIYILAESWSNILGLDLFNTAKWFPISFFIISPLLLYSVGARKYSPRVGLVAASLFSFLYMTMLFHSLLHRETLAVPFLILSIYFYFRTFDGGSKKVLYTSLTLVCSALCIVTHHLTSFILIIFFLSVFISGIIAPLLNLCIEKKLNLNFKVMKERFGINFFILIVVITLGHWMIQDRGPIEYFFTLAMNESVSREPGAILIFTNIRLKILLWGEIIFALIFAVLSIGGIAVLKQTRKSSDIGLLFFSALISILMIVTLFGLIFPTEGMGLGSRFQTFVYLGFLILSAPLIIKWISSNKKYLQTLMITLLLAFLLLNFLRVPVYLYDDNYTVESDETRLFITIEEASAALFVGLSGEEVATDLPMGGYLHYVGNMDTGFGALNGGNYSIFSSQIMPDSQGISRLYEDYLIYTNGKCNVYYS